MINPVSGLTLHVPSPGTVKLVTSPFGSSITPVAPAGVTKLTVVGSSSPSGSLSFANGSILTAVPDGLSNDSSSCAIGGTFT